MKKILFTITLTWIGAYLFANTYIVVNTNDGGTGSLRQAIQLCLDNPAGAPHFVHFQIPDTDPGYDPETGVWTIVFEDEGLPAFSTGYITVDGTTQTSFAGDTNPYGPEICLNGSNRTVECCISLLNSSNNTIKGLIINEFLYGIQIYGESATQNKVVGCYLGCNYNGSERKGNVNAIEIISGASYNQIGDVGSANRNLVSGNEYAGIRMSDSHHNLIINNLVGVNLTGESELHNYDGITVEGAAAYNKIGGMTADSMNLASGNVAYGIDIFGVGCIGNVVQGNLIGTDITGSYAIPNTYGLLCDDRSNHNIIGGYLPGQGNLISGNTAFGAYFYNNGTSYMQLIGNKIGTDITGNYAIPNETGVHIDGASYANIVDGNLISGNLANGITVFGIYSDYNVIIRNKIGTDISGINSIPNGVQGILVTQNAANTTIGGSPEHANLIAFNGRNGVKLESLQAKYNLISCNTFLNNAYMGIEIFPDDEINQNDEGDIDDGPNAMLNSPEIENLTFDGSVATISGIADVQNPATTKIEIYRAILNTNFIAEGVDYLGYTYCDASGNWSFNFNFENETDYYTAICIDEFNNTSEFAIEYPDQTVTFNLIFGVSDIYYHGSLTAEVSGVPIASPAVLPANTQIFFTATPDDGYRVKQWYRNFDNIDGNLSNYYMISELDEEVEIVVEFEPITSTIDYADNESFSVFPNPVSKGQNFFIQSTESGFIEIRNLNGQIVYRERMNDRCNQIIIDELQSGIYFVKVISDLNNDIKVSKLIVK
ncbi:MAG TPA: T9SS type A sorting domain-containing protein [Bacteroidales bacterium]|nr:T9SS type A sorting domain-containing protein [Bacteroidales bacterium]